VPVSEKGKAENVSEVQPGPSADSLHPGYRRAPYQSMLNRGTEEKFMRTKWLMGMVFFCFNAFSPHFGLAQNEATGPKAVYKEREFYFGEVMEGETIEHSFRVQNMGDQTLNIKRVKPG
jgi:hypothetical protein